MTLEEIARLRLEIDDSKAKDSLEDLQKAAKDINSELKLMEINGEKGSDAWKELKTVQRELNAEMKEFARNVDISDASMNELESHSRQLNRELKALKVGSDDWIDKMKEVQQVEGRIREVKQEIKGLGDEMDQQTTPTGGWGRFKEMALGVFTGQALLQGVQAVGQAIWDFGKEVFETSAKFEKYEAVLANSLGSHEAAQAAMEGIKEMAATTPYSVDELTDSYIKYVNRGLTPSMEEMKKLGDIAASQGKSFEQLTEAVLDATTGEFERLKEFGIQASKSGDQVEFSFRGVNQTVKNTPEAIEGALLKFAEMEGVAGSMGVQMDTLDGRLSNVGDNFDSLKIALGDRLKPVFNGLLEAMNWGIEIFKEVLANSEPIGVVFDSVGEITANLWGTIKNLIGQFDLFGGAGITVKDVMGALAVAFRIALLPIQVLLTTIQALYDGFNVLINKGKEVANFFGASFKIDPKANFDTLKANADKNFDAIKKGWVGTEKARVDETKKTNTVLANEHKKSNDTVSKEAKKAAEKSAKDRQKAETDAQKRIQDLKVAAIKDDLSRNLAAENLKHKRELDRITTSKISEKTRKTEEQAEEKRHQDQLGKIQADAADKKKKDDEKARLDKEKADKDHRDKTLKAEKDLFDAEFRALVEKEKLALELTVKNSQAQFDAKKRLLDLELKEKKQKLQWEADAEKARIAQSISDHTQRAAAEKAIDERLKAAMAAADAKFQTDKSALNTQANEARKKNNEEFFAALKNASTGDFNSFVDFMKKKVAEDKAATETRKQEKIKFKDAVKGLMQGDFTAFTTFLSQKLNNDTVFNSKRFQNFAKATEQVGQAAVAGIQALQQLNQKYLESQLKKIEKEKTEQLASWERQYKSGKITKEQYEKGVLDISDTYRKKELEEKKKAFERDKKLQLAMAIMNGAMAFVKALASGFFPVNLVFAALTAVAAGIQIAAISRQKFSARKGYVSNAGVPQGPRHGMKYGDSGISLTDRSTGQEIGEMEGGEPFMILSRNTYKNNGPVIDRLLDSSLHRNGAPITLRDGGAVGVRESGYFDRGMYLFGAKKKKKEAEEAARQAEQDAAAAQAEASAGGGADLEGGGVSVGATNAQIEKNNKMQEEMLDNLKKISANTSTMLMGMGAMNQELIKHSGLLDQIKNKPTGISLHDLHGALHAATAAARKSNL